MPERILLLKIIQMGAQEIGDPVHSLAWAWFFRRHPLYQLANDYIGFPTPYPTQPNDVEAILGTFTEEELDEYEKQFDTDVNQ